MRLCFRLASARRLLDMFTSNAPSHTGITGASISYRFPEPFMASSGRAQRSPPSVSTSHVAGQSLPSAVMDCGTLLLPVRALAQIDVIAYLASFPGVSLWNLLWRHHSGPRPLEACRELITFSCSFCV